MGCGNSKADKNQALSLCKERRKFIKQAIESRYALAAAHVSYIQSLRNIGISLRRYAEAEVLIESSLSISAAEMEKTPSQSSYPSPSPSRLAEMAGSPLNIEHPNPSPNCNPNCRPESNLSYMKSGRSASVTVKVNPSGLEFAEDVQPPPPLPFEPEASWDYFEPSDDVESFRFLGQTDFGDVRRWEEFRGVVEEDNDVQEVVDNNSVTQKYDNGGSVEPKPVVDCETRQVEAEGNSPVERDSCTDREDPSDFITHRAKDFLSSIKDIEHRYFRASESGREVSRMLESNKIRVGYADAKGRSLSSMAFLATFQLVFCRGKTALISHEPINNVTKVITWKRTTSSRSSSSRNPLATTSKDDADDSGSDFFEEFCMIAGSHSSTLDRLYAWERKLYDEVKASESIRKEYDQKCEQLKHQFAKDHKSHAIDKTRAVVKDLHSRIRVAIHSVDSISTRIEKIRDEELQPQLVELIQGLTRMWKAMLECHHAQYITISLAYHSRRSGGSTEVDGTKQIIAELQEEIECFGLSFTGWVNSLTSYVEALHGWLQHCIIQPQERTKMRRPFSPRRALAPPIFVLCRDWSAGIKALPSEELSSAVKTFSTDLCLLMEHVQKEKLTEANNRGSEEKFKEEEEKNDDSSPNLSCMHTSLTKVLDRLHKFSEASLKMYEDIRQKSEAARVAYYSSSRPVRF